ncbi:5-methyltetrahydropteroyltriglutamate--homocysteine methyltransferase [archaeon HR01]|nr:5-methyltetrahydropteroyltriglutamate--homocysteine methyltransferase [archaeon HR01]
MLFPTMEVGSLRKAPFITGDRGRAVEAARRWGLRLSVPQYERLVQHLSGGSWDEKILLDWASIYGLKFFEAAGLDIIYDGEARRHEMYEHPIRYVEGFSFRGLVRVWDNEYYYKAAVTDRPRLKANYHLEEFLFNREHTSKPLKVPITGPYTLADWSFDEYYLAGKTGENPAEIRREARHEMAMDLARYVVGPVARSLAENGATHIQVDEPAAATKPSEVELVVDAVNEVVKGLNAEVTVHICYTDYSLLLPSILDMRIANLSISCSNADTTSLGMDPSARRGFKILELFREYSPGFRVAPGVIDVHTDFIESPQLVRDRLLYSARGLDDPAKVVACNDCGLRTRSWEVAFEKELSLVEGARLAREALG